MLRKKLYCVINDIHNNFKIVEYILNIQIL